MGTFGQKKDIDNTVLDWDLYWENVINCVDNKVIVGKMENLGYYAGKSEKPYEKIQLA